MDFYLLLALSGGLSGMLTAVLPGIGVVAVMAMLLPAAAGLAPLPTAILLTCMCCGAQYGNAVIAILVNRPANPSSPVRHGGYLLARQGKVVPALTAAASGTLAVATAGLLLLVTLAPLLAKLALQFGPAEYLALMVLVLTGAAVQARGALLRSIGVALLGLLLGLVGTDAVSGVTRFTLDVAELHNGIGLVIIAMGVVGYGDIISRLAQPGTVREVQAFKVQAGWPAWQDFKDVLPAVLRANAGLYLAFIPLLVLGLPGNAVMALLGGALALPLAQSGPSGLMGNPDLFWGLIVALCMGNVVLALLSLAFTGLWARLLSVPYRWLFPVVLLLCAMGIYATRQSVFAVWLVAAFGVVGYVFHKLDMAPTPLLLGYVMGPVMEGALRSSLEQSEGDWSVFVTRPLSAGLLTVALGLVFLVLIPGLKLSRLRAWLED